MGEPRRLLLLVLTASLLVTVFLLSGLLSPAPYLPLPPRPLQESVVGWQERGPRSLSGGEDYEVSATPSPRPSDLLFITVRTTLPNHHTRLPPILKTWFQSAPQHIWFVSDAEDDDLQHKTNGHLISTNCSRSHERKALCCKLSAEFDAFLRTDSKWFCHFDDDNYVNVDRLLELLAKYSPQQDWYLGKTSISSPVQIHRKNSKLKDKIKFWFATGGAGFCISRALALKMTPLAGQGKFASMCDNIRLPDDVTMGYIIEHVLGKKLKVVGQLHSHLEAMKHISGESLQEQISFSYHFGQVENVVRVDGFDKRIDPTRFLSLHCHLFPRAKFCP